MFGSIAAADDTSYDLSFSNSSSPSSYLNSSETYLSCIYPNLSHNYFEDVKPFQTSTLDHYPFTDTFFDDDHKQTPDSIYNNDYNRSYEIVLAEIRQVLKSVCDTHSLPLAQTWSLCAQQRRDVCQQQQSAACISVITCASYVLDPHVLGFYEACCEQHLLRGEGIAGKALVTNQPCFATDVTAFCRTEYPLTDHAKMFGLGGAVAIRVRSNYVGPVDFILEFFLPRDCRNEDEQKRILSSISCVIQRVSTSLRVINDEELSKERGESSWISHMLEAQQRGETFTVSMWSHKEEPQEFKVINEYATSAGRDTQIQTDSRTKGRRRSLMTKKTVEKRRVKAERNISLPLLQQYFPGSLKDAAKNIGVCPTTLKRICREHGIMRWPSRKIKKVGHSLKKLQLIIDSVEGAEGTIQLGSFYTNFPELNSPAPKPTNRHMSASHSSSCGSYNSDSKENPDVLPKKPATSVFRVKVVYGENKIRLHMSENGSFEDLQREIMRRFSIHDMNSITLKYLDDDSEWVLLTCDADLEECMDINVASKSCTIKLFVHKMFQPESYFTGSRVE